MKFSIIVNSAPQQGQGAWSAYHFACAVLAAGHSVHRVFFYHDGVWNGDANHRPAQDERNLVQLWSALAQRENLDLVVCISAARRRGIVDKKGAECDGGLANLAGRFELSGLGQYTEALLVSDRTISFGG